MNTKIFIAALLAVVTVLIAGLTVLPVSASSDITTDNDQREYATGENVQGSQDIVITGSRIPLK